MTSTARTFRLFANCVPVRGARRSVICDLQRRSFRFIPNGLYEILTEYRDRSIEEIRADFDPEDAEIIDEYFEFLLQHEFGFWCDEPECFPELDLSWEVPRRITNAIIDVDAQSRHLERENLEKVVRQLDDLGCEALELRAFEPLALAKLKSLLEAWQRSRLRSIELLVAHDPEVGDEEWKQVVSDHQRLTQVVIHSAPDNRRTELEPSGIPLHYRKDGLTGPSCCGQVHPGYFVTSLELFTEGQRFNTCLNRKISVDSRGEIKNCPSMPRSFGNIETTSLHAALAQRDFKELWDIHKDQIDVCKDCEFRYVCTDCRAYLSEPGNRYSKPAKCDYDPYSATWGKTASSSSNEPRLS